MSPRFVEVENVDEIVDEVVEHISQPQRRRRRHKGPEQTRNLLHQETVLMTVLAQDPIVVNRAGPIVDQIPVPADRVQLGPRNHRFHVVDISVNTDGRGSGWDPHMIVLGYGATRLLPRDLTTPVTSTGDTYLRIDNRFNPFRATTRRGLLEWQASTDPCRVILSDARARCPRRGSAR